VKQAKYISVGRCDDPKCKAVHFALFGSDEKEMIVASVGLEHIPGFIDEIKNAAYAVAVLKGTG
jgi:hypothetical protein